MYIYYNQANNILGLFGLNNYHVKRFVAPLEFFIKGVELKNVIFSGGL